METLTNDLLLKIFKYCYDIVAVSSSCKRFRKLLHNRLQIGRIKNYIGDDDFYDLEAVRAGDLEMFNMIRSSSSESCLSEALLSGQDTMINYLLPQICHPNLKFLEIFLQHSDTVNIDIIKKSYTILKENGYTDLITPPFGKFKGEYLRWVVREFYPQEIDKLPQIIKKDPPVLTGNPLIDPIIPITTKEELELAIKELQDSNQFENKISQLGTTDDPNQMYYNFLGLFNNTWFNPRDIIQLLKAYPNYNFIIKNLDMDDSIDNMLAINLAQYYITGDINHVIKEFARSEKHCCWWGTKATIRELVELIIQKFPQHISDLKRFAFTQTSKWILSEFYKRVQFLDPTIKDLEILLTQETQMSELLDCLKVLSKHKKHILDLMIELRTTKVLIYWSYLHGAPVSKKIKDLADQKGLTVENYLKS